jgi:hypothetical protein
MFLNIARSTPPPHTCTPPHTHSMAVLAMPGLIWADSLNGKRITCEEAVAKPSGQIHCNKIKKPEWSHQSEIKISALLCSYPSSRCCWDWCQGWQVVNPRVPGWTRVVVQRDSLLCIWLVSCILKEKANVHIQGKLSINLMFLCTPKLWASFETHMGAI